MLMMGVYRKTPLLVTGFLVGAVVVYQVTYSLRDKTKDVVPAPKAPAVAPVAQPNQAGDANLRGAEEDGITIQFEKTEGYTTHGKKITVQKRVDFPVAGFSRHSHIGKLSLPLVIKKFSFEDKTLKGIPSDLNVINSSVYFKTGLKEPVLVELYKYSPDGHNTSVHFFTKGANETWEEFFFNSSTTLTGKLNELTGTPSAGQGEAERGAGGEPGKAEDAAAKAAGGAASSPQQAAGAGPSAEANVGGSAKGPGGQGGDATVPGSGTTTTQIQTGTTSTETGVQGAQVQSTSHPQSSGEQVVAKPSSGGGDTPGAQAEASLGSGSVAGSSVTNTAATRTDSAGPGSTQPGNTVASAGTGSVSSEQGTGAADRSSGTPSSVTPSASTVPAQPTQVPASPVSGPGST
ncbi:hypothetical protein BEWA_041600 [Theileria equi strain WA]|uniref:Signal peptide containing protein n=1 Tax=Theileria equi strain WA TaxID=1537102 RepID=L1LFA8_THEEQ|nr:hypothetical protein BEWA_041600 [Theileria equi strain WA]EKX74122.1 hypothetical protein BEWA_041600 [Theileria equi strain WA]|eukprot:XP_004833574.1 hypothetical protein BEWA_041600 [Theileria equi strain WA]